MNRISISALLFLGVAMLGLGCVEEDDPIDTNVESKVTVTAGVYGQLILGCDTEDCVRQYFRTEVGAFAEEPVFGAVPEPMESTFSDEQGFYELVLTEGAHVICPLQRFDELIDLNGNCLSLTVANDLSRCDFTAGPGGGRWICTSR